MKNILFVSHDANRAGAQILLLRFLQLLKVNTDFQFSILLKEGGIIQEEFQKMAEVYFWNEPVPLKNNSFVEKIKRKFLPTQAEAMGVLDQLAQQKFDFIISNTVTNGDILPALAQLNIPIVTYVHELDMGINQYTKRELFRNVKNLSTSFIACAESVKQNLINNHGVDTTKIKVLPSLLPEDAISFESEPLIQNTLRNRFKIPMDAFIVGGMGTVDLRKGVDVFLQVARKLADYKDIYFIWVGGQVGEIEYKNFLIDKKRLELDHVFFQATIPYPLEYIDIFDVFFLSSREDPYPLVVLEAAALGKPIICFDKAGGAKDFVENDCGAVVDYLDVDAAVQKIVDFKENIVLREQMGENARKKVEERHNQNIAFQTFVEILDSIK
jgi:glycosyltransferase involved in cell wall biosynthesis